ncbi:MAG: single-stranded DNA-binding protein [Candidatus Korarchaeota archaeon NZ13-K]|nr:MAG: single-stranded DNA-binding protein [Candidatus Korarchaeota archaeon NZ13-K]
MSTSRKVLDLRPGESSVDVKVRVLEVGEPRVVETKRGPRTLSEATVGDETGRVVLVLWGEHAGKLREGDVVELQNAFTTVYRGKVQLNLGNMGRLSETNDEGFVKAEDIPEDMPEAQGDFRPQRRRRDFRGRDEGYRGRPKW